MKVSVHAIDWVTQLFKKYLPYHPDKPAIRVPCECPSHSTGTGFPCIHTLEECWVLERPLQIIDFHPQWWLVESNTTPINQHLHIQVNNPRVVTHGRGRPAGATSTPSTPARSPDTRRIPSSFEVVQAQQEVAQERGFSQQEAMLREEEQDQQRAEHERMLDEVAQLYTGAQAGASQRGAGRGAGRGAARGRGAAGGRRRGRPGQYMGIPGEFTGVMEF